MKSKKSQFFMILVVIIAVIVLTSALLIINLKRPYGQTIGWRQATIFKAYQEAEKAFFYIDQSAKYSAQQTVYELAQRGGHEDTKCDDYFGYSLWNNETKKIDECFPDYQESFKSIFNENLNKYLMIYSDVILPRDNYQWSLKNKLDIMGRAELELTIPITSEKEGISKQLPLTYIPSNTEIDAYLKNINSPLAGIGQCIIDSEKRTKVPAIVILGVTIHESNYGKSGLAQKSKNLFGIKCSQNYISNICTFSDKKECCKVWDKTALDLKYELNALNAYRIYQNWCESVNDFTDLISKFSRYKEAMQHTDNPELMITKIREAGYATDPNWARGITSIMRIAQNEIKGVREETIA